MRKTSIGSIAMRFAAVAILACACTPFAQTQDPKEDPQFGTQNLKVNFVPDPVVIKVEAGGAIEKKEDGFVHFVAKKPDVRLNYTAGKAPLTIYAQSDADTTLLINLPNGKWIANDDGEGTGLNPMIKFTEPLSGTYDIWVGTLKAGEFPAAKLFITELK